MGRLPAKARERIEAQGFVGYGDPYLAGIQVWLRLSPAVCLTWAATGVVLGSAAVLAALVPFALAGALMRGHPFDLVYNYGIRHLTGGRRLPAYGKPRRFACLMAGILVTVTATALYTGYVIVAYGLGFVMIVMAGVNVTTGFCVPSYIFGLVFGRPGAVCDLGAPRI